VQAGQLNRQIVLYERTSKLDGAGTGQDVGQWAALNNGAGVWCRVRHAGGLENFTADQVVARRSIEFLIRWRLDVLQRGVEMAIVYEGRAFEIDDVEELGNREGLVLRGSARAEALTIAQGASG
jgi:SPP1 family predicted phage head-tail adaptor